MKTLSTVLLGLSLVACGSSDPLNRAKQDYACSGAGGVYNYVGAGLEVTCRNGALKAWIDLILPEEFYPPKNIIIIGTKRGE